MVGNFYITFARHCWSIDWLIDRECSDVTAFWARTSLFTDDRLAYLAWIPSQWLCRACWWRRLRSADRLVARCSRTPATGSASAAPSRSRSSPRHSDRVRWLLRRATVAQCLPSLPGCGRPAPRGTDVPDLDLDFSDVHNTLNRFGVYHTHTSVTDRETERITVVIAYVTTR